MDALRTVTPLAEARASGFAQCLLDGLSRTPKEIPCKYFYDEEGSRLFEAICDLPEYYQTRTETALLARHADEIAALIGPKAEIVEFGAGALKKVRLLLDAAAPNAYTPIDISGDYLLAVTRALAADYPNLGLRPVVADFTAALCLPPLPGVRARAGFFPGSTIGNFKPDAAAGLLRRMRAGLNGGSLLIGVDLVKDPARLHAAYNDAAGITALFNKNLLARANRELEGDFDLDGFDHYAPYNPAARRIEMYLVSRRRQSATVCGHRFDFAQGEAVHTEDSHKYTPDGFAQLAARAGWRVTRQWRDVEGLFLLAWMESV
ncbi:MAG: L-histidine N(alpha)-methyltransferase [Alphaproteobacteria bacterium]|nr:L-histidine N(alpha)-methyltransferase [Alphaproteobacteria bacterium]